MDLKHLIYVSLIVEKKKQDKHSRCHRLYLCTYVHWYTNFVLPRTNKTKNTSDAPLRFAEQESDCRNPVQICKDNLQICKFNFLIFLSDLFSCIREEAEHRERVCLLSLRSALRYFCSCWDASNTYIMTWMCLLLWKCDSKALQAI